MMDFHSLKRKQLQSICKKHGIPANKTNLEMADMLTLALKEKGDSIPKEHRNEKISEDEQGNSKKVRFSPHIETRQYEPSGSKGLAKRTRKTTTMATSSSNEPKRSILRGKVGNNRGRGNGKIGSALCTRQAQAEANKEVSFIMENETKTNKGNKGCQNDPQLQDSLKGLKKSTVFQKGVAGANIDRDGGETRKGATRSARNVANFTDSELVNEVVKSDDGETRTGARRSVRIGAKSDSEQVTGVANSDGDEPRKGARRSARNGAKITDSEQINDANVGSAIGEARKGGRRSSRVVAKLIDGELVNDGVVNRNTGSKAQSIVSIPAVEGKDEMKKSSEGIARASSKRKSVAVPVDCGQLVLKESRKRRKTMKLDVVSEDKASSETIEQNEKALPPVANPRKSRRKTITLNPNIVAESASDEVTGTLKLLHEKAFREENYAVKVLRRSNRRASIYGGTEMSVEVNKMVGNVAEVKEISQSVQKVETTAVASESLVAKPSRASTRHASKMKQNAIAGVPNLVEATCSTLAGDVKEETLKVAQESVVVNEHIVLNTQNLISDGSIKGSEDDDCHSSAKFVKEVNTKETLKVAEESANVKEHSVLETNSSSIEDAYDLCQSSEKCANLVNREETLKVGERSGVGTENTVLDLRNLISNCSIEGDADDHSRSSKKCANLENVEETLKVVVDFGDINEDSVLDTSKDGIVEAVAHDQCQSSEECANLDNNSSAELNLKEFQAKEWDVFTSSDDFLNHSTLGGENSSFTDKMLLAEKETSICKDAYCVSNDICGHSAEVDRINIQKNGAYVPERHANVEDEIENELLPENGRPLQSINAEVDTESIKKVFQIDDVNDCMTEVGKSTEEDGVVRGLERNKKDDTVGEEEHGQPGLEAHHMKASWIDVEVVAKNLDDVSIFKGKMTDAVGDSSCYESEIFHRSSFFQEGESVVEKRAVESTHLTSMDAGKLPENAITDISSTRDAEEPSNLKQRRPVDFITEQPEEPKEQFEEITKNGANMVDQSHAFTTAVHHAGKGKSCELKLLSPKEKSPYPENEVEALNTKDSMQADFKKFLHLEKDNVEAAEDKETVALGRYACDASELIVSNYSAELKDGKGIFQLVREETDLNRGQHDFASDGALTSPLTMSTSIRDNDEHLQEEFDGQLEENDIIIRGDDGRLQKSGEVADDPTDSLCLGNGATDHDKVANEQLNHPYAISEGVFVHDDGVINQLTVENKTEIQPIEAGREQYLSELDDEVVTVANSEQTVDAKNLDAISPFKGKTSDEVGDSSCHETEAFELNLLSGEGEFALERHANIVDEIENKLKPENRNTLQSFNVEIVTDSIKEVFQTDGVNGCLTEFARTVQEDGVITGLERDKQYGTIGEEHRQPGHEAHNRKASMVAGKVTAMEDMRGGANEYSNKVQRNHVEEDKVNDLERNEHDESTEEVLFEVEAPNTKDSFQVDCKTFLHFKKQNIQASEDEETALLRRIASDNSELTGSNFKAGLEDGKGIFPFVQEEKDMNSGQHDFVNGEALTFPHTKCTSIQDNDEHRQDQETMRFCPDGEETGVSESTEISSRADSHCGRPEMESHCSLQLDGEASYDNPTLENETKDHDEVVIEKHNVHSDAFSEGVLIDDDDDDGVMNKLSCENKTEIQPIEAGREQCLPELDDEVITIATSEETADTKKLDSVSPLNGKTSDAEESEAFELNLLFEEGESTVERQDLEASPVNLVKVDAGSFPQNASFKVIVEEASNLEQGCSANLIVEEGQEVIEQFQFEEMKRTEAVMVNQCHAFTASAVPQEEFDGQMEDEIIIIGDDGRLQKSVEVANCPTNNKSLGCVPGDHKNVANEQLNAHLDAFCEGASVDNTGLPNELSCGYKTEIQPTEAGREQCLPDLGEKAVIVANSKQTADTKNVDAVSPFKGKTTDAANDSSCHESEDGFQLNLFFEEGEYSVEKQDVEASPGNLVSVEAGSFPENVSSTLSAEEASNLEQGYTADSIVEELQKVSAQFEEMEKSEAMMVDQSHLLTVSTDHQEVTANSIVEELQNVREQFDEMEKTEAMVVDQSHLFTASADHQEVRANPIVEELEKVGEQFEAMEKTEAMVVDQSHLFTASADHQELEKVREQFEEMEKTEANRVDPSHLFTASADHQEVRANSIVEELEKVREQFEEMEKTEAMVVDQSHRFAASADHQEVTANSIVEERQKVREHFEEMEKTDAMMVDQSHLFPASADHQAEEGRNCELKFLATESADLENDEQCESSSFPVMKRTSISGLIPVPDTPHKVGDPYAMKENEGSMKMEQLGCFTASRMSQKRRPLEDLRNQ